MAKSRHQRSPYNAVQPMGGRMIVVMMMVVVMRVMVMDGVGGATVKTEKHGRSKRSAESSAEWSVWFNSDKPWKGEGDFETSDAITKIHRICSWQREAVEAQCRIAGTNHSFDSGTAAFVEDRLLQACSRHGLICLNAQQKSGRCHDYEVRFLCQKSDVDEGSDSLFPKLDFKIYILLAAVPLLVITLRLLWTCCWKPRIKRRRQQQRRSSSRTEAGTLSTSSSQASNDSALANPPPNYSELFGDSSPPVFSISDGECAGCGKCLHASNFGVVGVTRRGEGEGEREGGRRNGGGGGGMISSPPPPPRSPQASQDVSPSGEDEVFFEANPLSPQNSNVTAVTQTVSRPPQSILRSSLPSSPSPQGAVAAAALSPTLPPQLSPTSPTQCTCACHHQLPPTAGHVNRAFQADFGSQTDSSAVPAVYPGMHKPVFNFPRIGSVTSFTSLPDYEEALEIMKKNGLFLEDEKL
ncbi:hypothetical protein ACOMHN_015381 [Nucella lapillus]